MHGSVLTDFWENKQPFFSENDVSMNNLLKMQCKESLQWIHVITESFKYFLNFYGTLLVKPRQVENG